MNHPHFVYVTFKWKICHSMNRTTHTIARTHTYTPFRLMLWWLTKICSPLETPSVNEFLFVLCSLYAHIYYPINIVCGGCVNVFVVQKYRQFHRAIIFCSLFFWLESTWFACYKYLYQTLPTFSCEIHAAVYNIY